MPAAKTATRKRAAKPKTASAKAAAPSASAPDTAGVQVVSDAVDQGPFLLMSGYAAANTSPNRGYLWWPSQDPRRELSPISAREIRRRVHWLLANFGFARRLVKGMAKLVGVMTPYPTTPDEAWNDLAFDNFRERAGSAALFDLAGKFDFFTAQPQINRLAFKDGYSLAALTENWNRGAAVAFYEAAQLGNPDNADASWVDGVQLDRHTRHLRYGVLDPHDDAQFRRIDARSCLYHGIWESHAQVHPASILAAAVVNMIDVVETRSSWKTTIKDYARLGIVLEKENGVRLATNAAGVGGPIIQTEVTKADGTKQNINWEQVMTGATAPQLPAGVKVRVVHDDRPSPENAAFEKALLRDCTWGVDLPFEALCEIAGLTGPGVRYVMAEVERWVLNHQHRLSRWCQRYYAYHLAMEIKAGRLPQTQHAYWRDVEWIGQPSMTIDRGRDGNVAIHRLDKGLSTWADEWAQSGAYWKRKLRQRIKEVAWAKAQVAMEAADKDVELSLGEIIDMPQPKQAAAEPNPNPDQP